MIHKQVVNHRQISWLVGSVLMSGMMISFLQSLVQIAKMDAWFTQLLPVVYAILVAYVFTELARVFPGKNLFEILFIVCGKWGGGALNLLILLYIWTILALDVKGAADFLHGTLLPQTPLEIILLVFVLMMMYYGRTSLEVAARVNEIYFPAYFFLSMSLYILLGNEYSIERLEPILTNSLQRIMVGNILPIGVYGDILLFGAFLHAVTQPQLFFAAMKHGILIVGFTATMILVILLGVMGHVIASRLNFPVYVLVQQIHVTDFLDRIEIILFSLWFPAFTIKVIVAYLAFMVGLGAFGGQKNYTQFNAPCGYFLIVSSMLSFPQIADIDQFVSYSLPIIVMVIQIPLLVFLFVKARRQGQPDTRIGIQEGTKLYRFYRRTVRIGYFALLSCGIVVIIGEIFIDKSTWWGLFSAISYIVCFFLALVASYAEMQALNHGKQKTERHSGPGAFRQ